MINFSTHSKLILGSLTLLALAGFAAVELETVTVKQRWYYEKLSAAQLTQRCLDHLRGHRLHHETSIDITNDPNGTALIGYDHSPITTERAAIEAKLSATNPNHAAVVVELMKQVGVAPGDVIAISFTGSYPGWNIAVLSALETLNLTPLVISSVGASSWGANDPQFTWLDMERVLHEAGILRTRSLAASIGGGFDRGMGLDPLGRALLREAIARNGVELIDEEHLEQSIEKRIRLYKKHAGGKRIKTFISVGGGSVLTGASSDGDLIPEGLNVRLPLKNGTGQGLIARMAQENIPVIHLSNPMHYERLYGLSTNPLLPSMPGSGAIFERKQYSVVLTLIVTTVLLIAIAAVLYLEKRRFPMGSEIIAVPEEEFP